MTVHRTVYSSTQCPYTGSPHIGQILMLVYNVHHTIQDKSLLSSKEMELASHEKKLEKTLSQQQAVQQADDLANQHYQALSLGVTNDKLQTASLAQQVIGKCVCSAVCILCRYNIVYGFYL